VLQGDELRSVLENMPLLAEALAKQLGVGIGELRKLGSEGKLTADRVFPALLRATEDLGAQLDKAPLSLSRAFGQLQVATDGFLGHRDCRDFRVLPVMREWKELPHGSTESTAHRR
jgi:hypothetical protein